jgi:hypothetical protein
MKLITQMKLCYMGKKKRITRMNFYNMDKIDLKNEIEHRR